MRSWLSLLALLLSLGCGSSSEEASDEESSEEESESDEGEAEGSDEEEDAHEGEVDDDELGDDLQLETDLDSLAPSEEVTERVAAETRGIAHILVRFDGVERNMSESTRSRDEARQIAEGALSRAEEGDFGAVAADVSDDDATKDHGGELGAMEQGLLPEPVDEALFEMEVGEVRGPIESPFGFHVIKRTS